MRIRKRFLSLSAAISPPPSTDPHGGSHQHNNPPPLLLVQQKQLHPNGNLRVLYGDTKSQNLDSPLDHCDGPLLPPPSDDTTQIGLQTSTWVSSGAGSEIKELIVSPHKELESEEKEIIKTNGTGRKESTLSASLPAPPTTSNLVMKGWLEGDRLIPIKKRRGSSGKEVNVHDNDYMIEEPTKQARRDDRCVAAKEVNRKNGKRGNVIMEGSRCSRVNGRGWRCGQQTLVGYSLCEHHLGKGRVRSMNSVRGRAKKVTLKEQDHEEEEDEMISIDYHDSEDDWEEESVSTMKFTKKKKLGVVKARSLSSLLSQMGS